MEDSNNNKRVAPPLKFLSLTKNHSFTSNNIKSNARLSTPKVLGSSPLFNKYQERHDPASSHSEKVVRRKPDGSRDDNLLRKNIARSSGLYDSNTEWSALRSATAGSSWLRRPRSQPSLQLLNSDTGFKLGSPSTEGIWYEERKTASHLMLNRITNGEPSESVSRADDKSTPKRGLTTKNYSLGYSDSPSVKHKNSPLDRPKYDSSAAIVTPDRESLTKTKNMSNGDVPKMSFNATKDYDYSYPNKKDSKKLETFSESKTAKDEMSYSKSSKFSHSDIVPENVINGTIHEKHDTALSLRQESPSCTKSRLENSQAVVLTVENNAQKNNDSIVSKSVEIPKLSSLESDTTVEPNSIGTPVGRSDSDVCSKTPSVTRNSSSSSSSSSSALMIALSQPTPSPRRKPRVSRKISHKPIILDDDEFIGFATLPDQVHRKAVKRGFEFSLMVVGETGLGKSTLINSLFLTDLYKERKTPNVEETVQRTVNIEKKQLEIEERGVKLRLTIVDTPGFNEAVNGEESWKPIVEYVDKQFDQYYQAESGLNRKNIVDARVHCCLYFVSPYGHGLKPIDVLVMKKLHHKVNIVPLLAKSDILTPKEVKRLKVKILEEIESHNIQIYQFPDCDSDEDEDFKQQDKALKAAIPFAVVGSNTVVEAGGKKIRGRMYPWGIVEVDNPKHCDFGKLRQMLISTHMQDLKDITSDVHYENYRAEHLAAEMNRSQRERSKLKRDSAANLDAVMDTDKLLQQKEAEIQRMQAMLAKMQAQLQSSPSATLNGKVSKP